MLRVFSANDCHVASPIASRPIHLVALFMFFRSFPSRLSTGRTSPHKATSSFVLDAGSSEWALEKTLKEARATRAHLLARAVLE